MVLFVIIHILIFHSIVDNEKRLFQIYAFNHIEEPVAYDINYQGLTMKHTYESNGNTFAREYAIIENPSTELININKLNMIIQFKKNDKFDLIVKTKFNSDDYMENWSLDKNVDDRIIEVFNIRNVVRFAIRILIINVNPENGYRLFTVKLLTINSANFYAEKLNPTHHNTGKTHKNLLVYPKLLLIDKYFQPNITNIIVNTIVNEMNENTMLLLKNVNFKFGENYVFYKQFENKENTKSIQSYVRIRKKLADRVLIDIDYFYFDKISNLNINGYSLFEKESKFDINGKLTCKHPLKKGPPLCNKNIYKPDQFRCFNKATFKLLSSRRNPKPKNVCECQIGFFGNNCLYSSKCLNIKLPKNDICLKAVNFEGGGDARFEEINDTKHCFKGKIVEQSYKTICACANSNHTGMFCELYCKSFCICEKCKYNRGSVICNCQESKKINYDIVLDLRLLISFLFVFFAILIIAITRKILKVCRLSSVKKYTYEKSKHPNQQYCSVRNTLYEDIYYLDKSQHDFYEPNKFYDFHHQSTLNVSDPPFVIRGNESNFDEASLKMKDNCTINTSTSYKINWKETRKKYNSVDGGYGFKLKPRNEVCDKYICDIISVENTDDNESLANSGFYEVNNTMKRKLKQNKKKILYKTNYNATICKSMSDLHD